MRPARTASRELRDASWQCCTSLGRPCVEYSTRPSTDRCPHIIVWTTIVSPGMLKTMKAATPRPARRGRRFDSLEQEVFLNLWRTYDRLGALEEALFARFDLTPQQYNALRL